MSDKQQYFFVFSSGEYSDYGIGNICVCDHEVKKEEWNAYYKVFQDESSRLRQIAYAHREKMTYAVFMDTPEYLAYQKFITENDPEKNFQKLHGMTVLDYEELWRDG